MPDELIAKTSDRPHNYTLIAAFGALLVSVCSLVIAIQSYTVSSTALRVGQRAYIGHEEKVLSFLSFGKPASVLVTIRNVGSTPAYKLSYVVRPINPQRPDTDEEDAFFQPRTLGPKESFSERVEMDNAESKIIVEVTYSDVFGREHSEEYCFLILDSTKRISYACSEFTPTSN